MTSSHRSHPPAIPSPRRSSPGRTSVVQSPRPRVEALERRLLMTGYYPAVADYNGDGVDDIAALRYDTSGTGTQQAFGDTALLMQLSKTGTFDGYDLGPSTGDRPVAADFDGDGKADPAVYGFMYDIHYGNYYGTTTDPSVAQPYPNGSGRFAYIPSSGVYPATTAGSLNGTATADTAKVVVVNMGGEGDLPAVADYDGDGKADFAVYEPSKAQFLYYFSASFNPYADPQLPGNAPYVLPFGKVGDVPASADYEGAGHAQFAVYDAASGTFFVRPSNGGATISVPLGGPGDIPVPGDYEGVGHADYAVYDPSKGVFLYRPADGSATRTVAVGAVGDTPAPGKFGDGKVDFATYTPSTMQFHISQFGLGVTTRSLGDPDTIPIERTDDYATGLHQQYLAQTANPDVLFLGDSITYRWPSIGTDSWLGRFTQFDPLDRGVYLDSTQNLLWRLENGEMNVHPKVAVLEIGTNDFIDRTPAQVAETIKAIMAVIHTDSPTTSILLMGVFPRGSYDPSDTSALGEYNTYDVPKIRDFDQNYLPLLATPFGSRSLSSYPTGDYSLDLRSTFSVDPSDPNNYYANLSLFSDGVHPTMVGYQLWASAIATPLRLLLDRQLVPGDYDGDGKTDIGVYGPTVGAFASRLSSDSLDINVAMGITGAGQTLLATGDYDGDGRSDYAVYEPSVGAFSIFQSSTNTVVTEPFGIPGAGQSIPAPGDYDGDGKTDLAVYLPALGAFAYRPSSGGADVIVPFGLPGEGESIPAPGDYDGDGKTDLAVYLPAFGEFAYRPSSGGKDVIVPFGLSGVGQAIPAPGDYDGNGRTDLALYLPLFGAFAYRNSVTGKDTIKYYGIPGIGQAIPAPGDYDGDGITDFAVYGPSVGGFAIDYSANNASIYIPYGIGGTGLAIPTTARYDVGTGVTAALGSAIPAGSAVTASASSHLGAAQPAGSSTPTVAASAVTSTTSTVATAPTTSAASKYQATRVAQATPTGPVAGWKMYLARTEDDTTTVPVASKLG